MTNKEKIELMRAREQKIELGGGAKALEKVKATGRLTARERLARLFDEGTFVELDKFVEHRCVNFGMDRTEVPGEGVVTGYGMVNGRTVFAFAQDTQSAPKPIAQSEYVRMLYEIDKDPSKKDALIEAIRQRGIGFELTDGLRSLTASKSRSGRCSSRRTASTSRATSGWPGLSASSTRSSR